MSIKRRRFVGWSTPGRGPRRSARASSAPGLTSSDLQYLLNLRQRTIAPRIDVTRDMDRRFYHPDRISGWPRVRHPYTNSRVIVLPYKFRKYATYRGTRKLSDILLSHRLGFENPRKVLICVRRSRRRQVLHARGLIKRVGRAAGRVFRPRRNADSDIRC